MARQKVVYRRGRIQNGLGMLLICLIVAMLLVVVSFGSRDLQKKREAYAKREAELEQLIEDQKKRAEEIQEYEKYTKTKKYVEEVAKEKLGLVYPGEVVFIPEK